MDGREGVAIRDLQTSAKTTWSSNKISSQISSANEIRYTALIPPLEPVDSGISLAQKESHFYGRLIQLDGNRGSGATTLSFLLFIKANYDNPQEVFVTQLAGMDDDRKNISYETFFSLGVSDHETLIITNKTGVMASYRLI